MIKLIKKWIKAWMGIKDEEMDPHAELYLKKEEPEVSVVGHCKNHSKYKFRCPDCREALK
jgi:hypothetical protein